MKTKKPRFPNTLIRASAGTGKTFQLSNRFLDLVFTGAPLDSILATTFTRKAAAEILDRVLLRLAEAVLSPDKLAGLAKHVGLASLDSAVCRHMLGQIVRQMHRLRVGTLDSFFIEIARTFSLELGLPPGWEIVDDIVDQGLRAKAIRKVLQDQSTGDAVRLMHMLTKGDAARSVSEQIAQLVKNLYSYYQEAPKDAWQSLPHYKYLAAPELAKALATLGEVSLPPGKPFANARQQAVENTQTEAWEDFLGKGLAAKILAGEDTFSRQPISQEVVDAYSPLIRHATAVIIGRYADQTEATQKLLERFDAAYQALKFSERALRFEDITRKLGAAEVADRLDDVLYRLDARVCHLLLDEFQDTSPSQWRVLRPLARRIVRNGAGQSFFCVGDVKQAIYGWRGGVAEIFEVLDKELDGLQPEYLNQSRRSSHVVIDCVNQVFAGLVANPVMQKYGAAAQKWKGRFTEHSTVHDKMPGYCSLATAPLAGEDQKQAIVTLCAAADEIVRLHREMPGCSIGVLVRRNAAVARLIYELRQRGIEASEEGGNPLTDSPAVELVLSLLTLADHPGDTIARFHLANSPLGKSIGLEDHQGDAAASRLSLQTRQSLATAGYGPTIYQWTEQLAVSCDHRDLSRLLQLVELAYRYEAQAGVRVDDFVNVVRQQRIRDPAAADVRVMTVHQAKGLQFDIVVLPELDVKMVGQTAQHVVSRPEPTGAIEKICRYVPKGVRPLLPAEFNEMFSAQERQVVEESLCGLYVAMTRAIHALHMIVSPSKEKEGTVPGTYAGLLRAALFGEQKIAPGTLVYEQEHGDARWFAKTKPRAAVVAVHSAAEAQPLVIRLATSPSQSARGLDRRSPSQLEGPRVNIANQLRLDESHRLDRGSLLHAWFQEVEWLDDGQPEEAMLRSIAARPEFCGLNAEDLLKDFRAALTKPAVREVLCRSTYQQLPRNGSSCTVHAPGSGKRWQVWRERPFAIREGDTILSGKFDRVTVLYDGNQIIAADVVDYKTDRLPAHDPGAIDVRVETYRPQLDAYRRAAARLCRLAPEQVSVRLLFLDPGLVRML